MVADNEDPDQSWLTVLSAEQLTPASLYQQLKSRIAPVWPALQLVASAADKKGWALYLVGGAVRDLLLGLLGEPYPLIDIDLVVEGAESGAGVTLAEAVRSLYPQVSLQVYGNFQTAALTWLTENPIESTATPAPLLIDIATARTESYPYPAANPEVESSTLRQDLHRRDFTINAMALRLNGDTPGQLVDVLGGTDDLQQRLIRVLHTESFIDDPTRIFRAVRFASRLDFSLEPQTERLIMQATSSGLYPRLQLDERKVPALQGRLKAELKYLLSSAQWAAALSEIERLGALVCLQEGLSLTPTIWQQLRRLSRWLSHFDSEKADGKTLDVAKFDVKAPHWLMLLELLIAQLEPDQAASTAKRLTLDDKSQHRLENLHQWEALAISQLGKPQGKPRGKGASPSQVYRVFHGFQLVELLLMAARYPYTLCPYIWQYIVRLSQISSLINGATLKRLGYQPGPHFKDILAAVHQLHLDGKLVTASDAEAYVVSYYPLQPKPV